MDCGGPLAGATFGPDDGFLHPHIIYQEGFRRARELGADVRVGTEVVGAETRGGRVIALRWRAAGRRNG